MIVVPLATGLIIGVDESRNLNPFGLVNRDKPGCNSLRPRRASLSTDESHLFTRWHTLHHKDLQLTRSSYEFREFVQAIYVGFDALRVVASGDSGEFSASRASRS